MTAPLSPVIASRLEKAALDNGFDRELPRSGTWLGFASSQTPLRLWLTALGDSLFLGAVSQLNVAKALAAHGAAFTNPLPPGAAGARSRRHPVAPPPRPPRLPALPRAAGRAVESVREADRLDAARHRGRAARRPARRAEHLPRRPARLLGRPLRGLLCKPFG